jgi:hypothetical protein
MQVLRALGIHATGVVEENEGNTTTQKRLLVVGKGKSSPLACSATIRTFGRDLFPRRGFPSAIRPDDDDDESLCSLCSPLGLLEELFGDDPWRLLLSTILLNRTRRIQVDLSMHTFLQRWPTAESTIQANVDEISDVIAPLGIRYRRARGIVRFSREYLELLSNKKAQTSNNNESNTESTKEKGTSSELSKGEIMNLFHCGEYASDAYRIFVQRDWDTSPTDHALQAYVEWKRGLNTK